MEIAGLILGVFALIPTLFPLLVQVDKGYRNKATGVEIPWKLWCFWSIGGGLLGLYFLEVRDDLIALPVEWFLVCFMSLFCWFQQVFSGQNAFVAGTPTREILLQVLKSSVHKPFVMTVGGLVVVEIVGLILFALLTGTPRVYFLSAVGIAGCISFLFGLLQLPYDRDLTLNSSFGAFMPLALMIQIIGAFCSLIVYSLLYVRFDFVGIAIFLALIFGELGLVIAHSILRKRKAMQTGTSSYAHVDQDADVDADAELDELDREFEV